MEKLEISVEEAIRHLKWLPEDTKVKLSRVESTEHVDGWMVMFIDLPVREEKK